MRRPNRLYKRSLAIREKAFGAEHRSVGTALNNLGLLYAKRGRYSEAEPLYERSLSIAERTMGPEHPSLGTSLNNLGLLYHEQGRFADAEPLFKRDLAIQEKLGLEHPNVAGALNNIALIHHGQGGDKATEKMVKDFSAAGTLVQARIVHFATHGLLGGETEMLGASKAEPALLLTPPNQPTEADDGLLTASAVAQLRLNADWVVLSACNTAAGDGDTTGTEALSGLARAFFYAGARALLVSHWAVDSEATVKLVTKTFDELKRDNRIGRAEALRRSMRALIGSGGGNAHPANWAPFVVAGEGAR